MASGKHLYLQSHLASTAEAGECEFEVSLVCTQIQTEIHGETPSLNKPKTQTTKQWSALERTVEALWRTSLLGLSCDRLSRQAHDHTAATRLLRAPVEALSTLWCWAPPSRSPQDPPYLGNGPTSLRSPFPRCWPQDWHP